MYFSFHIQKETYSASIPTWAFVALGVAAFDDVLLWFTSPMLAIPLTIILLLIVLAFFFGGRALTDRLFGAVRSAAEGAVANVTRSAASSILKKSSWLWFFKINTYLLRLLFNSSKSIQINQPINTWKANSISQFYKFLTMVAPALQEEDKVYGVQQKAYCA